MRKESVEEGTSMSDSKSSAQSKRSSLKLRRKLPFGENITSSEDPDSTVKKSSKTSSISISSLTPRRNTPLSERQQIALLCKLSVEENPSADCSPASTTEEKCCTLKRNERGETALHLAVIKGDHKKVHNLLKQGFNVNTTDFAGWTPLHEACNHGWSSIAKLLLQFDANVNALGLDKFTPLHDAAANKHEDVVQLLLKYGADPLLENARRKTPLDLAGPGKIADLLREAIQAKEEGKEIVGPAEESPSSPSQPTQSSCKLTMRKNSPQNQTHKSAEKPTSPRFTLKFQIRSGNDKGSSGGGATDVTSPQYPSYCVTMETKSEASGHSANAASTEEQAVTSTTATHHDAEDAMETESSGKPFSKPSESKAAAAAPPAEKMDTGGGEGPSSKVNGGSRTASVDSNTDEADADARRKRRRSNDGKSSGKGGSPKTPQASRKRSSSSSDTEDEPDPSPKVPPLKIVIPSSSLEAEASTRKVSSSSKPALPYVVNTTTATSVSDSVAVSADTTADAAAAGEASASKQEGGSTSAPAPEERSFQRVTRSTQHRLQQAAQSTNEQPTVSSSSSRDEEREGSEEEQPPQPQQQPIDVHPRKRKLRQREVAEATSSGGEDASSQQQQQQQNQQQQQLNSYQMFLNIRKQVDKRRKAMFPVHPKPPQGFKDYLLNRCSYVLEGNSASLCVPVISPPQSLEGPIKEFFVQQEKERYRLRLQHLIEREKLVLSVEQETLRVHGRAARAMVNQTVPLSACSILKDEEIYNVIEDDKDKNIRTRYNGRLFISWLQDVDDKWKKIKELMLLRHHNEAESLHAVQKLDWEWKLKELSVCDMKTTPLIDDIHVPMVHVNDDFELLPPANP